MLLLALAIGSASKSNSYRYMPQNSKSSQCSNDSTCPTWFTYNNQNHCQCGHRHSGAIACNDEVQTSAVLVCHCVICDPESRSTYVGPCFYNPKSRHNGIYNQLPKQPKVLINNSACAPFHETGSLCGDCEDGYSPQEVSMYYSLITNNMTCMQS